MATNSSSSAVCCPVNAVNIRLISLGGAGCGIEVTNGIAYAIGTQPISVVYSDPCNAISTVLLNGLPPPILVPDGSMISMSVIPTISYTNCGSSGPICISFTSSSSATASGGNTPLGMAPMLTKKQIFGYLKNRIKVVRT